MPVRRNCAAPNLHGEPQHVVFFTFPNRIGRIIKFDSHTGWQLERIHKVFRTHLSLALMPGILRQIEGD